MTRMETEVAAESPGCRASLGIGTVAPSVAPRNATRPSRQANAVSPGSHA